MSREATVIADAVIRQLGRNGQSVHRARERGYAIASVVLLHRNWLEDQSQAALCGPCPCGCGGRVSPRYKGCESACLCLRDETES